MIGIEVSDDVLINISDDGKVRVMKTKSVVEFGGNLEYLLTNSDGNDEQLELIESSLRAHGLLLLPQGIRKVVLCHVKPVREPDGS